MNKQQTALLIAGQTQEFWHALAAFSPECYDATAEAYDNACTEIENGELYGTSLYDEEIDITGYPIRQRPPVKPVY